MLTSDKNMHYIMCNRLHNETYLMHLFFVKICNRLHMLGKEDEHGNN